MSADRPLGRPFTSLLVANRGEIARRVFRTARSMGLATVAVFVDADAEAPFVTEADQSIRITSYLDGEAIIGAARTAGAGAVHPGYGFLAENAGFAAAVEGAGLAWVGPPPSAIESMGDKIRAKELAVAAGVPVLPSSDDPAAFGEVGYPLLIKAAAGGGGKGMRIVEAADGLDEAIASARREAAAGFGDDRVFAERYVTRARHVEVQIMGDAAGNVAHLGERECSIQRRHQKVVEEAPSPFVGPELRAAMGRAAVELAGSLGYRSAGTVEFLVDDETGDFFFLEVNTRLQVEHPVTEEITGRDLVRDQLLVAMGQPIDPIDVAAGAAAGADRHAIEVRLYAEDPATDYLPSTGTVAAFRPADEPALRWDTGVEEGSAIGVDFDPMIAKVVASGPTRAEAAGRLALGLERLHLGAADGLVTNRDFLVRVLRHPAFLAGDTTTDFLDRFAADVTGAAGADSDPDTPDADRAVDMTAEDRLLAIAAALWLQGANRAEAEVLTTVPSGFLVGRLPPERVELDDGRRVNTIRYRSRRDGSFAIGADGGDGRALVHRWSPGGIDLELDGRRATLAVTRSAGGRLHLTGLGGGRDYDVVPRFAPPETEQPGGGVAAPMPGRVLEVRVQVGQVVRAGEVVAILEAMKMENHLAAAEDGTVTEVRVAAGDQVEKDTLLLVIEASDETAGS
ncbi:MAG: biotin carboxylase N-terminal domain-containing protein [Actinomycetota bacterium]